MTPEEVADTKSSIEQVLRGAVGGTDMSQRRVAAISELIDRLLVDPEEVQWVRTLDALTFEGLRAAPSLEEEIAWTVLRQIVASSAAAADEALTEARKRPY